jgi:hypothetical protein
MVNEVSMQGSIAKCEAALNLDTPLHEYLQQFPLPTLTDGSTAQHMVITLHNALCVCDIAGLIGYSVCAAPRAQSLLRLVTNIPG